ncbi:MAG: DUF86 domain-containing protein [Methanocorpusculum sp.]|nr:DUF86 domain-containing protein [Methanocorpusculum sp.]
MIFLYLRDIRDQSKNILNELNVITYDEFCSRKIYQNGMILSIIIIGEAAKQLSEIFCEEHSEIPVSSLAKTRDKLVHGYQGIDIRTVWQIVTEDIPILYDNVMRILDDAK